MLESLKRENSELKAKLEKYGSSQDANVLQIRIYEQKVEQLEADKRDLNSQIASKDVKILLSTQH